MRRRPVKTRAELLRDELGESFDHLMRAAAHAAEGVGTSVGPRVEAAREQLGPLAEKAAGRARGAAAQGWGTTAGTLAPLAGTARARRRRMRRMARRAGVMAPRRMRRKKERQMARKRGMMFVGLLAAAAAVGAIGALITRRRQQQRWAEYEPGQMPEPAAAATPITEPMAEPMEERPVEATARHGSGRAG